MEHKKLSEKPWFPNAVAGCIIVVMYVALTNLDIILGGLGRFFNFFSLVFMGCVLAYLINPLAKLIQKKAFGGMQRKAMGWNISVALSVVVVLLLLLLLMGLVVPQFVDSIAGLLSNLDSYMSSLTGLVSSWGLAGFLNLAETFSSSEAIFHKVMDYVAQNLNSIASASALAGKGLLNLVIAVILSVYLLMAKDSLKAGVTRLMKALFSPKRYDGMVTFFTRCDHILIRYIVFSLLDSAIVGAANAVFMLVLQMQYLGLVSVVVAVTNLIPTFGPVIGMVVGGFVLLLVNPWHALAFLVFSMVLQFLDGYVIKPKLFGDSLGVSGLLILIAVVVGGNMFGVVGILLAIPAAAILDFVYRDYLLPGLENRKKA